LYFRLPGRRVQTETANRSRGRGAKPWGSSGSLPGCRSLHPPQGRAVTSVCASSLAAVVFGAAVWPRSLLLRTAAEAACRLEGLAPPRFPASAKEVLGARHGSACEKESQVGRRRCGLTTYRGRGLAHSSAHSGPKEVPVPLRRKGDSPIFADFAAKIGTVRVNGCRWPLRRK
jgi:hypothetical protein